MLENFTTHQISLYYATDMETDSLQEKLVKTNEKVSELKILVEVLIKEVELGNDQDKYERDIDTLELLNKALEIYERRFSENKYDEIDLNYISNSQINRSALVNIVNLLDSESRSWPRTREEHLAHGFSVIAANTYTLYGVTEKTQLPLPSDIKKFPQKI